MKSRKVVQVFKKPSRTVKSEAYNHDINAMIAGRVPFTQSRKKPFFIDETILPENFEDARNLVIEAQDAFMRLPAEVRAKFDNDPAFLARAIADPAQHDALRKLGVLEPLPPIDHTPAKPITEPSEKAKSSPPPSEDE